MSEQHDGYCENCDRPTLCDKAHDEIVCRCEVCGEIKDCEGKKP